MTIAAIVTGGFGSFARAESIAKQGLSNYVGLPEPPATGKQYVTLTSVSSLSHLNATVAAVGDIESMDLVASLDDTLTQDSGDPITLYPDGVLAIDTGGEETVRFIGRDLYDVSLLAFDTTIPGTVLLNNSAPVPTGEILGEDYEFIVLEGGVAMTPLDFTTLFFEPDGHTFTVDWDGSHPTGLEFTANVLSGTPTGGGNMAPVLRVTDQYGRGTLYTQKFAVSFLDTSGDGPERGRRDLPERHSSALLPIPKL